LGVLKNNLAGIRTGRATPGLLDSVKVTVYGSQTPLKQLASVGAPEPQQLVIRPFDPSTIKDIEKAIVASELGLNPQNDGRIIRINIPSLTEDRRKDMMKKCNANGEEGKVAVRNERRDCVEA
ncbi:MAG: ribosome recycling factor, partial [Pirellula sp.]